MSRRRDRASPLLRLDAPGLRARLVAFDERGYQPARERGAGSADPAIRCPSCHWQPRRDSLWYCLAMGPPENFGGGCGTGWHTFDTRGRCPGCAHQWRHTTCLACNVTSPHDDWYVGGKP